MSTKKPPTEQNDPSPNLVRRRFLMGLAAGAALSPLSSVARMVAGDSPAAAPAGPSLCAPGVIMPSLDLSYQGLFRLFKPDESSTFLGWSFGALTGRVVAGEIRLFITGNALQGDPVYEVRYPGVGPQLAQAPIAPLVTNWGHIYQGRRLVGNDTPQTSVRGLLWADDVLLWSYGHIYAVTGQHNPSIGASVLNPDGTVTSYGPWRTSAHSQQTRGYMVRHPLTGQVGYGAPITSGNALSPWGAAVNLGDKPNLGKAPDDVTSTKVSIPTSPFVQRLLQNPQRRYDTNYRLCGWNVKYDASQGAWTKPGPDSFDTLDIISAAAWVHSGSQSGIVCFGQLVQTLPGKVYGGGDTVVHRWYGPGTCPHGQDGHLFQESVGDAAGSARLNMWVFDPSAPQKDPTPYPIGNMVPSLDAAKTLYNFGGAWFEPASRLLFVSEILADRLHNNFEPQPVVHVFQVA